MIKAIARYLKDNGATLGLLVKHGAGFTAIKDAQKVCGWPC